MNRLVRHLLWNKKECPQLIMAAVGFTVGLFVLFSALRFMGDLRTILYPQDAGDRRFIVMNKKVKLGHTLGRSAATFSGPEMATLKSQAFVKDIGPIVTTNFTVSGSFMLGLDRGLQSELFLEAVDDRFLDIHPPTWQWQEGHPFIPVIVSRDFLALYNFGFAAAQGYPQLTEDTLGFLPIPVLCSGDGGQFTFTGQIVGLSDRFFTVLVPQAFMDWANQTIGQTDTPPPSRVVLEVDNTAEAELQDYFKRNDYETNREKLAGARVARVLRIALFLVSGFGILLVFVSLLSITLTIQLLVSRALSEIQLLHQLGFTDTYLGRTYVGVILPVLAIPFLVAGVGVLVAGHVLNQVLAQTGYSIAPWPGAGLYLAFTLVLISVIALFYLLILRTIRHVT